MSTLSKTLSTAVMVLAGLALQGEDFSGLMQVTKSTWPEKTHIGVICDYGCSREKVEDLARAAGNGSLITVVDIHTVDKAHIGAETLAQRRADFLVLLPEDRFVYDGSFGATMAISHLAMRGIPSIGTTPKAILQGAAFSMGDATNQEVLVANRLKGTVDVTLPTGTIFSQKSSLPLAEGMATIAVFSYK